ncbi:MAG TPA: hypothetical protein VHD62_07140 [Opitutaceae bacterium]|nr:hypothetical protein [Opitutaceae bacterium]
MFEHRSEPLLPRPKFYRRLARSAALGGALVAISLLVGTLGYWSLAHLPWIDAFLNAAMILSGMGPVAELHTAGAKIFAGLYAIYSGIALISTAGVVFAPILHRMMHKFHLQPGRGE